MNFYNTKIKPNIIEYTNEELIEIIKKDNESIETNNLCRDTLITKVNSIWDNLVLGPDIDCPICLENITNSDNMITACGHHFHSSCMIKYIVKSKSNNLICCPKCRTNIYSEDDINNNNNNLEYDTDISSEDETNVNYIDITDINNRNYRNNRNNFTYDIMYDESFYRNINYQNNVNNQLVSDSDSSSGSDSDSESENNYSNGRQLNHMSGVNSTVINYFRGSNIPIDIVSGLWTEQFVNEADRYINILQNMNQTNLENTDDTDTDEELKKFIKE